MPDETVVEDQVVEEPVQEGGEPDVAAPAPGQEDSDKPFVPDAVPYETDEPVASEEELDVSEPDDAPVVSEHDAALRDHKACAGENYAAKEARKRAADNREVESEPEPEPEAEDEPE